MCFNTQRNRRKSSTENELSFSNSDFFHIFFKNSTQFSFNIEKNSLLSSNSTKVEKANPNWSNNVSINLNHNNNNETFRLRTCNIYTFFNNDKLRFTFSPSVS